ncbi:oxygenase [Streptomyces adustus]|uniref:oxygenase n=1 Tax=Streptomyces adustus TaxID=1609272 RepID=UPI001EE4A609|nr:oxygenase [Streptomyces adustus]
MPHAAAVVFRDFDDTERDLLVRTARTVLFEVGSPLDPAGHRVLRRVLSWLPAPLAEKLGNASSPSGLTVFRGVLRVDDVALGDTPEHWSKARGDELWDTLVLLLAMALGRPMAFPDRQEGRFVHNLLPSARRSAAGDARLDMLRTEDAFHPQRAHLLLIACMRNHDAVPVPAASIRHVAPADDDIDTLMRPHLPIHPGSDRAPARFADRPTPVPVLWSTDEGLMMRFDPGRTPLQDASPEFSRAYGHLAGALADVALPCNLGAGDVLVVENDVVALSGPPITARRHGQDQWLKRALVHTPHGARRRPSAEAEEHGYGHTPLVTDLG